MATSHENFWAVLAPQSYDRETGKYDAVSSIFVANIVKTTDDFFWYRGGYSTNKRIARSSVKIVRAVNEADAQSIKKLVYDNAGQPKIDELTEQKKALVEERNRALKNSTAQWDRGLPE